MGGAFWCVLLASMSGGINAFTLTDLYFVAFTVFAVAGAARFPLHLRGARMVMDTAPAIAAVILLDPLAAIAASSMKLA